MGGRMTSFPGSLVFLLNSCDQSKPFPFITSKKPHPHPQFFEQSFIKHLLYIRLNIHLLESSRLLSFRLLPCSPAGPKCPRQQ